MSIGRGKKWWALGVVGVVLLIAFVGGKALLEDLRPRVPLTFFTPQQYPAELAARTHFGMINVASPEQLRESLRTAQHHGARLQIDFSPVLLQQRPLADIKTTYSLNGAAQPKSFSPLAVNKVKNLPDDLGIDAAFAPYWPVLREFPAQVGVVFLADEPYMHGLSKQSLEQAAARVRSLLREHGLSQVQLGVVFAGAMFDPEFAQLIAARANDYVVGIEQHHQVGAAANASPAQRQERAQWAQQFARHRLTTYDLSGNLYLGGGIPAGFEVVAYDLYTATLLQDAVHARTLDWFARSQLSPACQRFIGMSSQNLREQLTFYRDGPVAQTGQLGDKQLLDQVFSCKSEAMLALLKRHAPAGVQAFQLWGESSANGFLEFDALGRTESGQPQLLVEARVFDEVTRTLAFYDQHRDAFKAGVIFFIYDDTLDRSIDLHIAGAKGLPSVTNLVFQRIGKTPQPAGRNP